jgi:predicted NAD/FAD-binding protein
VEHYVVPMGRAIWSAEADAMLRFPARFFIDFFHRHGFLSVDNRPTWRTVAGGSREYVRRVVEALGPRARIGVGAAAVTRGPDGVRVRLEDGSEELFDHVVLASHAPQSLALLKDADAEERALLGAFRYSANQAILHSDPALMPRRRKAWSSWNFLVDHDRADTDERPAQVTYWMNRLQALPEELPLFVSLNPRRRPAENLVHGTFAYDHPLFDCAAFEAQGRMDAVQGRGGVWHAGAWLGYGFHEDGLRSGLRVADMLGARPAWAVDVGLRRGDLAAAAE